MNPQPTNDKWYAIYTKSRFEKKIYNALQKTGFTAFLPLIKEKRVWSDRIKTIEVPMLPSYVFVKIEESELSKIYYFSGFVRFVAFDGKPCEIKACEIELMEKISKHGFSIERASNCKVGDWVKIIRGPLKGWEGRVENKLGNSRILFHFECVQQTISVEINLSDIEKIKKPFSGIRE